jgi:hypothetical protein
MEPLISLTSLLSRVGPKKRQRNNLRAVLLPPPSQPALRIKLSTVSSLVQPCSTQVSDFRTVRYQGLKASASYAEWQEWRQWVLSLDAWSQGLVAPEFPPAAPRNNLRAVLLPPPSQPALRVQMPWTGLWALTDCASPSFTAAVVMEPLISLTSVLLPPPSQPALRIKLSTVSSLVQPCSTATSGR